MNGPTPIAEHHNFLYLGRWKIDSKLSNLISCLSDQYGNLIMKYVVNSTSCSWLATKCSQQKSLVKLAMQGPNATFSFIYKNVNS